MEELNFTVNETKENLINPYAEYGVAWWESCRISAIFYGTISSSALLLNALALLIIMRFKKKDAATLYIVNLVAVDLITPILQLVLVARDPTCYKTYRGLFYGEHSGGNKISRSLTQCCQGVGYYAYLFNALFMSVDRFIATWSPFSYSRIVNKTKVIFSIVLIWVAAAIMGFLPYLIALSELPMLIASLNGTLATNEDLFIQSANANIPVGLTVLFSVACLVFCWVVFVYAIIFREIRRHHRFTKLTRQQSRGIVKGTVMSALIVGTFALCWLPFGITFIHGTLSGDNNADMDVPAYTAVIQWRNGNYALILINSVCDPIIFILLNTKMRQPFSKVVGRVCGNCSVSTCWSESRSRRRSSSSNALTLSTTASKTGRSPSLASSRFNTSDPSGRQNCELIKVKDTRI